MSEHSTSTEAFGFVYTSYTCAMSDARETYSKTAVVEASEYGTSRGG